MSLQGTFAFSLIKYTPLKYNNEYVYPWWGYAIGWLLALSSMVCIPLWMVYKISTTKGTFREVTFDPVSCCSVSWEPYYYYLIHTLILIIKDVCSSFQIKELRILIQNKKA